jgi:hypothetical protein
LFVDPRCRFAHGVVRSLSKAEAQRVKPLLTIIDTSAQGWEVVPDFLESGRQGGAILNGLLALQTSEFYSATLERRRGLRSSRGLEVVLLGFEPQLLSLRPAASHVCQRAFIGGEVGEARCPQRGQNLQRPTLGKASAPFVILCVRTDLAAGDSPNQACHHNRDCDAGDYCGRSGPSHRESSRKCRGQPYTYACGNGNK